MAAGVMISSDSTDAETMLTNYISNEYAAHILR